MNTLLSRPIWHTRRALRSGGVAAAVVLLVALGSTVWLNHQSERLEAKAEEVRTNIAQAHIEHASRRSVESSETVTLPAQLLKFAARFPDNTALTEALRAADAAATTAGVMLERGDYQLAAAEGQQLGRYTLSIPVKGPYPAIQAFAGLMLAELPTLALDRVSFSRASASENLVEAGLTFTLFFRPDE